MANDVDLLIGELVRKEGALAELIRICADERRCIVQRDLAGLEVQEERKREALAALQERTAACRKLMARAAVEFELAESATLSQLIAKAPPQREELERLQGRLLDLGGELKQSESHNESLLKGALSTVNRSLEFFGRLLSQSTTYGESGRMVGGACRTRLLRREA